VTEIYVGKVRLHTCGQHCHTQNAVRFTINILSFKPVTLDLVHRVRQLYRIESLHLPGRLVTAAVLRTAIKETLFSLFN
jgi:hypothetical protein